MSSQAKVSRPTYPNDIPYPRNQWYVAAFSRDVGSELLSRVLLDTPVVLYRTSDGSPVALYDRCPHRGLPLSMGKLQGDVLQCGYHGIEFATDGKALRVPQQEKIYSSLCVRSFPVVDKGPFLWIWMGDPAKADDGLLPDDSWMGIGHQDECVLPYQMFEVDAHFQLVHDNLSDTSHLPYIHEGVLEEGGLAGTDIEFREEGQMLWLLRESKRIVLPPPVAELFGAKPDTEYDRWYENSTFVPSLCLGRYYLTESDNPNAQPIKQLTVNAVTPSTLGKTFIFDVQGNLFQHGSETDVARIAYVIEQDIDAWHVLQQRYEQFGEKKEISIISDTAGLAARRIMQHLVSLERNEAEAA
jgi:phenylpropionate dioxygenase-like ring-hydroxylating dioxygenase large terminal subunit